MVSTAKYEKNTKTTNPWSPKAARARTMNNRNSVRHNIITHVDNMHSPWVPQPEKLSVTMHGRARGISEFNDLSRSTAENRNVDHKAAMENNQGVFKRKDGIFTHLYNSAARFGEDKPFKA